MAGAARIYSVSELTDSIRLLLESSPIKFVAVEGELSGWNVWSSGHAYFRLKDGGAVVSCVMFASALGACACRDALADGVKVQIWGRLDVYAQKGVYQLVAMRVRLSGSGELMLRYEELRKRLAAEGLFDSSRKRPLPFLPRRIGIVTSPTGAVIHDMCTVLSRRFPALEIRLFPVKVQGDGAAAQIADGIRHFNEAADGWKADLLIVGRGGGSIEDLWAFNEELLVRAVAASGIPVVSAVGHESDFTLADFAADVRAGTPSIAAELAVPMKSELEDRLGALSVRLGNSLVSRYAIAARHLDGLSMSLAASLRDAAASREARFGRAVSRLAPALRLAASRAETRLRELASALRLLDPRGALERGYTITLDSSGRVVSSAAAVESGGRMETVFRDGRITSIAV